MIEIDYPAFIQAAEEDLASLKADEEELRRRYVEKVRLLEGLKQEPRRDLVRIVELEGQREALWKLLEEQRQTIWELLEEQRLAVKHAEKVLAETRRLAQEETDHE